MRRLTLPLMLATSLALTAPAAPAQDLEEILGGIADSLLQQELDKQAFIAAQNANTVTAYRNYLKKYPNGLYRVNAERALARLGAPIDGSVEAAAAAEAKLGITASQRVAVQRELTRLGYSTGGTDGVWGRNTRNAIATWQRDRKEKVTGYVTEAQLKVLLKSAVVVPPPEEVDPGVLTPAEIEASLKLTRAQRTAVQKQLITLGYDAGVADGLWGSKTRAAIKAWQKANKKTQTSYVTAAQVKLIADQAAKVAPPPAPTNEAALEEQLLELSVEERADLQVRLMRLGYDTGRTDGTFGAATRRAIGAWQADEGERVTGYLTADQVRLIWVQTGR
ncbi:MAG: peptidoglycan-binding protein [Tabrizicola sp.]|jgi:peptidoglycan hydrolase-like protein with peptidoglycan-binding domain|nr:peptidoglycan-binding protein [Tabrizicola sp.]